MYLGRFSYNQLILRVPFLADLFFQYKMYVRRGREQMRTFENGPIRHKVFLKLNNKLYTHFMILRISSVSTFKTQYKMLQKGHTVPAVQ